MQRVLMINIDDNSVKQTLKVGFRAILAPIG